MGQAQVPYQAATNVVTPGTLTVDNVNAGNSALTSQFSGPVSLLAGGTKAWMYQYLEPTGTKASSINGRSEATATSAAATTGIAVVFAMPIEAGLLISNMTLVSIAAEATGTHAWCGIADSSGKVLGISADNTAAAYFPATTAVTTAIATPFITAYSGMYYGFVCVAGGTIPTFAAAPALTNVAIGTVVPILCGTATALGTQTVPVAVGSSLGVITPTTTHQLYTYLT